jgi:WD40 repeat protein
VVAGGTAPSGLPTPSVPVGGRVADVALGKTDADGLAREAQVRVVEPGSVSTVATIRSGVPFGAGSTNNSLGYAAALGWSRDGTTFLLSAGRWSPSIWYHECTDLYLVRADGSSLVRLTDNGRPGYSAWESALAPDGATVAVVEADEATMAISLRVVDASGATTVVDPGSCAEQPTALAWSPDSQVLAAACGSSSVIVYRVANRQSTVLNLASGVGVVRLAWTADSSRLEASTYGVALGVVGLDLSSGSATVLQDSRRADLAAIAFSPDGTKLLVAGCPKTPTDPACFDSELDVLDVGTGTLKSVLSGPSDMETNDRINSARWIPDGSIVIGDPAGGTLIIDPATGRSNHSAWSLDAQLWLPMK